MFKVVGCIQGTGCDADKFYDVAWDYSTDTIEEAREAAEADHVFIERIIRVEDDDDANA